MITNLIATVLISVVTNWTDQFEIPFQDNYVIPPATFDGWQFHYEPPKGKYIGKDGVVIRITEIKFDYDGKPQVHRIEEPLETITM
ncbi:MAG: hypothetical protein PHN44_10955, partial [Candidatus Marinimicrobia bacterium]|nr:hypothetical protein [Candidatus Neomarinimicrobiota bacterium]